MSVRRRSPALIAALALPLAALAAPAPTADPAARSSDDQILPDAVAKGASLHSIEWQQHEIAVCWIDPDPSPEAEASRAMVRSAVHETWEAAADVRIVGWQPCPAEHTRMVRIRVDDGEWPHAVVGTLANSSHNPTMYLNFHLARRPGFAGCADRAERCLKFTAVHEFGHTLGLIHEQDRPETPAECIRGLGAGQRARVDRQDLDALTAYDPDSLMNYCSTRGYDTNQPLVLSAMDTQSIRKLFGQPRALTPAAAPAQAPARPPVAAPATPPKPPKPRRNDLPTFSPD